VANHVPHVRVVLDTAVTSIGRRSRSGCGGTPSIGVRPGDELLVGVWITQPGEDVIVARRLKGRPDEEA
jgi:hypothetical protein